MKKLVIYIPSIESGGVEKNLFYISDYFLKKKIDLYILTASKNKKKFFNKKIKFISPKNNKWDNSSRFIKTLVCLSLFISVLPKRNISVFSFQSNVSAIILSKILGLKIIIRLNTSTKKYINNQTKKFLYKFFYSMCDKIIVNSLEFKKNLKKVLKLNTIIIYNPIKNEKTKQLTIKYFSNFNGIKILSIGRLTDQKDQITILKSLKILVQKKINFRFFLIGGGDKANELKQYVKNNDLSNYIRFSGFKMDAFKYIRSSDLFILSSKFEGLPNVLIEAQLQGIPIISSDCSTGPKEILQNGRLGSLFKVGDYISLSKLILNFYKNKKIYLKKANLAKKFLFRYNYEKNLDKYYAEIKKIL
jgi:glycosyltransferase involved in cell wall biosynthesis